MPSSLSTSGTHTCPSQDLADLGCTVLDGFQRLFNMEENDEAMKRRHELFVKSWSEMDKKIEV